MSDASIDPRYLSLSQSDEPSEILSNESSIGSINPSQSASQLPSRSTSEYPIFNQTYREQKQIIQDAANKIRVDFPLLVFRDDDRFIEWNLKTHQDFQSWWSNTPTGRSIKDKTQKRIADPLWSKKATARTQSKFWDDFDQLASTVDGIPKIMCKNCSKILEHPTAFASSNTSTMKKHLTTTGCMGTKRRNSQSAIEATLVRVSSK